MTDKDFDRLLEKTVKEYGKFYDDTDYTRHNFSDDFEQKMKSLIGMQKQKKKPILKITRFLAGTAAVLVIGFIVVSVNNIQTDNSGASSSPTGMQVYETTAPSKDQADTPEPDNDNIDNDDIIPDNDEKNGITDDVSSEDISDSAAENPTSSGSTSTSAYSINAQAHGKVIKLSEEKINQTIGLAKQLVADYNLTLDFSLSFDEIDSFRKNGYYVTISRSDNIPMEIEGYNGEMYAVNSITLMLSDTSGYAVADYNGGTAVFDIPQLPEVYAQLEALLE